MRPHIGVTDTSAAGASVDNRSEADAWVEWSALAEPGDRAAGWLVANKGPRWARTWLDVATSDPVAATLELVGEARPELIDKLVKASERWARRRSESLAAELRDRARRCGARPIVPGDPDWPTAFDDLGDGRPMALWVRGSQSPATLLSRSIAVVGARSSTAYGEHVAGTMGADLADRGWTVVSGGAYGIDAAAHRGTLAAGGSTMAIMAGGVDRLYPAGNQSLLEQIIDTGAVVSETPPGWAPHRSRFLSRNRLIACANTTVVVEAAYRSGALSTATHAQELLRPVGIVPGPITSAASAGCHRLARERDAVLVTSAADVVELAGPLEVSVADSAEAPASGAMDFASPQDRAVYDAFGAKPQEVEELARTAGLTRAEVRSALGRLELSGAIEAHEGRWRRAKKKRSSKTH